MAVIFFIPVITQLVLLLIVTKLLLLLIFVIKVVPTIASGSAVSFFLYWRPNPENITCSFHLNQRQEFYISMYLRTLQISKKLCTMYG